MLGGAVRLAKQRGEDDRLKKKKSEKRPKKKWGEQERNTFSQTLNQAGKTGCGPLGLLSHLPRPIDDNLEQNKCESDRYGDSESNCHANEYRARCGDYTCSRVFDWDMGN